MLQHSFQDQFAPVALGFLPLQGLGQVGGLVTQAQVELLQALQFLAQGETFAGFLLVTFFHPFLEGLDALLERVEQLAEVLLAGLGEALLALIEDLGGHFGELGAQFITGALQVIEALLVAVLLLTQLGFKGRATGIEATQLGFAGTALKIPGMGRIAGVVAVDLQQVQLTGLGGEVGLLDRVGLAEVADLVAAGVQLRLQSFLGQQCAVQALFLQGQLRLAIRLSTLPAQQQRGRRNQRQHHAQHHAGQIQCNHRQHAHPRKKVPQSLPARAPDAALRLAAIARADAALPPSPWPQPAAASGAPARAR